MTKVICNLCNKPFVNLKSHQQNKHSKELKRLECPLCDSNSVYSESSLKKHYEQEHPTVHNVISTEKKIPAENNKSVNINVQENVLTENIGIQGIENELGTVKTETKTKKPTIKELQKYIFGLEDQLKASNNQNTKLTKEIEVRTTASDLENERIKENLRRITANFNNLRQVFNHNSSGFTVLNRKYALLGSESQGYRDRYDIIHRLSGSLPTVA